jgi:isopenicillin N synthase-like dioxygenase
MKIQDLETKGFMGVSYLPPLRRAVSSAVESWKAFCSLPENIKKQIPYSNKGAGVGYEMKDGSGSKGDKKENFDVALGGKEWLLDNANPEALEFVRDAVSLVGVIKPFILEFAEQVEAAFGIQGLSQEVDESEDAFFVRFIHYVGDREEGEETANAHVDQSGFSLHLFESDPGLQCLTSDHKWIDMPVSKEETIIIPSMQLQLRSEGKLKALAHRVVATRETAKKGRYSAVCFVQLKKTPKYDKEKWGRLQEMAPGFNYKIPHKEFKKYFKG